MTSTFDAYVNHIITSQADDEGMNDTNRVYKVAQVGLIFRILAHEAVYQTLTTV
jgi:hypothetical protein